MIGQSAVSETCHRDLNKELLRSGGCQRSYTVHSSVQSQGVCHTCGGAVLAVDASFFFIFFGENVTVT